MDTRATACHKPRIRVLVNPFEYPWIGISSAMPKTRFQATMDEGCMHLSDCQDHRAWDAGLLEIAPDVLWNVGKAKPVKKKT